MTAKTSIAFLVLWAWALALGGCGSIGSPPARMGMVKDPGTGLQFGSVVENNIVTDSAFFTDKRIKVRTRNTSGDPAFDLNGFDGLLKASYQGKGFEPTNGDDFGLLVDVNVMYSGQVQTNLAKEYAFLGATAGALTAIGTGPGSGLAVASGTVAGATLGSIIGSYVTDDTYIIVAEVTVGVPRMVRRVPAQAVTFSRSPLPYEDEDERREREERRQARGLKDSRTTQVAVFAGGRNTPQAAIADQVRQRFARILSDVI